MGCFAENPPVSVIPARTSSFPRKWESRTGGEDGSPLKASGDDGERPAEPSLVGMTAFAGATSLFPPDWYPLLQSGDGRMDMAEMVYVVLWCQEILQPNSLVSSIFPISMIDSFYKSTS
jgi:hypothetical protein